MTITELRKVVAQARRQYETGQITEDQYKVFRDKIEEYSLYHRIEDPVWEKPRRPITPPRPNKKSPGMRLTTGS